MNTTEHAALRLPQKSVSILFCSYFHISSTVRYKVIRFGTLFPKLKLDTEGIEAINVYLGEVLHSCLQTCTFATH
jgi:hypothetical protein